MKTRTGYTGDKNRALRPARQAERRGHQIDIAIFDHDKNNTNGSEEMHLSVGVSTGKSCEKAQDENPQTIDMGKKGGRPGSHQLAARRARSRRGVHGGLRAAVERERGHLRGGEAGQAARRVREGEPEEQSVAACIDRATRRVRFPASDKLDVVHEKF